jgi:hypothetical protein
MALTQNDIRIIQQIVNRSLIKVNRNIEKNFSTLNKYVLGKPYVLDMTYEQLAQEVERVKESIPEIPIVRMR